MDGLEGLEDVILLAATNRADMLDPALLRAGRFGRHIEIPMPKEEARREIFKIHLSDKPLDDDVSIKEMAKQLDGYTGADIASVCEEATLMTIRRVVNNPSVKTYDKKSVKDVKISRKEFNQAIKKVLKSAKKAQKAQKLMYDKKPSEDLYR
jgi:transitional endoplasmic reticulum ATPase